VRPDPVKEPVQQHRAGVPAVHCGLPEPRRPHHRPGRPVLIFGDDRPARRISGLGRDRLRLLRQLMLGNDRLGQLGVDVDIGVGQLVLHRLGHPSTAHQPADHGVGHLQPPVDLLTGQSLLDPSLRLP
jgi:hypothetical protein